MIPNERQGDVELVFLPGFDGVPELRRPFLDALARAAKVRAVRYPPYPLGTLDEYRRYAATEAKGEAAIVLVAESFSGLVAARWAASDPRVAAIVLCGCFARNPVGYAANLGAMLPGITKLGPRVCSVFMSKPDNAIHREWAEGLVAALRAMRDEVVAERLRLIADMDVGAELAALRIPMVLLQFERDLVIPERARKALEEVCHNAAIVSFPGPHFALEVQPAECAAAIVGHLRVHFPALEAAPS
jgi:pimeloyl-ACP methyl ester carboxylesterase